MFPQKSVAVQVLVTVNLLAQVPDVVTSLTVIVTVPEQLSVAVTDDMEATGTSEAQLTVIAAGVPAIVGGVVSFIVIVLETGANALPQLSVAVHVSVTFPLQELATVVVNVD